MYSSLELDAESAWAGQTKIYIHALTAVNTFSDPFLFRRIIVVYTNFITGRRAGYVFFSLIIPPVFQHSQLDETMADGANFIRPFHS